MKYRSLIITPIILYLSACATTSDPHKGGFMGGVQGLSSGQYDRRIDERQARLERMKREQAQLDNEGDYLKQNKSSLQKKIQQEKRKIAQLQKKNKLLEKKIAQLNADNSVDKNDLNTVNQRAGRLTQDISNTRNSLDALEGDASGGTSGDASVDRQRTQLEAQRKELENEYQLLLDMTLELGQ